MENLKSPAYPVVVANEVNNKDNAHQIGNYEFQEHGFTKLEKAALMIGQGICAHQHYSTNQYDGYIVQPAMAIAKAILEECNK